VGHLLVDNGTNVYNEKNSTPLMDGAPVFDTITTDDQGTILLAQGTSYLLPSSTIGYRLIVEGLMQLPSQDLVIGAPNGFLEWRKSTKLELNSLTVSSSGRMAHTSNISSPQYVLWIETINSFTLDGQLLANGKGYAAGQGPGVGTERGIGAAYAGFGGKSWDYLGGSVKSNPYGTDAARNPTALGSGSRQSEAFGNNSAQGGASGGGAIRIKVGGTFDVTDGKIQANGGNAPGGTADGGGSGGSIWIDANTLNLTTVGAGYQITTNGGAGVGGGGCGSGGRIALKYNSTNVADWSTVITSANPNLQNWGGTTPAACPLGRGGAAGTIYAGDAVANTHKLWAYNHTIPYNYFVDTALDESLLDGTNSGNTLLFTPRNTTTTHQARFVVLPSQSITLPNTDIVYAVAVEGLVTLPANSLTVGDQGLFEWRRPSSLNVVDVHIKSGGTVTHASNYSEQNVQLRMVVSNNLTIDSGGKIGVNEKGYMAKQGPGGMGAGAGAYGANTTTKSAYGCVI
jgi:hypothetical protein